MSSDKLGDKLRDKEKAEEDRYFQQQDKEKIADLSKEEHVPQLGLCPKDGETLVTRTVDDVEIDECGKCSGMWLDAGELESIVSRESEGWASKWIRSVLDGK
jgi:hypothetical protein